MNRSARFSERAILYGDGPLAGPLMEEIAIARNSGVRVVGFVGSSTPIVPGIPQFDDSDIEELVERRTFSVSWLPWPTAVANCRWKNC